MAKWFCIEAEWRKRLQAPSINPAFPQAHFYARTFETGAVAYLYERAVFQADAGALAMLLRMHENSQPGIRADALAAVAFAHFQWNTPTSKARGLALIEEALKGQGSYPAALFRGRAHIWGGDYVAKNLAAAMAFLAQAGRIPDERQSAGRRLDATNMQDLHAATLRHLLAYELAGQVPSPVRTSAGFQHSGASARSPGCGAHGADGSRTGVCAPARDPRDPGAHGPGIARIDATRYGRSACPHASGQRGARKRPSRRLPPGDQRANYRPRRLLPVIASCKGHQRLANRAFTQLLSGGHLGCGEELNVG